MQDADQHEQDQGPHVEVTGFRSPLSFSEVALAAAAHAEAEASDIDIVWSHWREGTSRGARIIEDEQPTHFDSERYRKLMEDARGWPVGRPMREVRLCGQDGSVMRAWIHDIEFELRSVEQHTASLTDFARLLDDA